MPSPSAFGTEGGGMFDADPIEAAAAPASVDTGFDTAPVTATVNQAPAPAPGTVETGFGGLGKTPEPFQQTTPTVNTAAHTGEPEDPDVDLDARVAALLPNKSTTDWNAVSAFMGAVVPWPWVPEHGGWVVMPKGDVSRKHPGGRLPTGKYPIGPGKAFKDIDKFVNQINWSNNHQNTKDLFFVLSLQRDVEEPDRWGNIKAKKSAAAALAVKAIWIDIDVEPGNDKKYQSVEEALAAAINFREAVGLPPFSAIVGSGGGIHLYWISERALTPDKWRPYAEGLNAAAAQHGLKCDLPVTSDIARMLRVPGSFNYKQAQPRPYQLFNVNLTLSDFSSALKFPTETTPVGKV